MDGFDGSFSNALDFDEEERDELSEGVVIFMDDWNCRLQRKWNVICCSYFNLMAKSNWDLLSVCVPALR